MLFFRQIMDNGTDLNETSDELGPVDMANINELTFYVVGRDGVVSGAVQAEEAHESEYAGTWAVNGSPVTVTANAVKTIKVTGVAHVARVRISTVMAGAGVDVWAMGRG